jgi:hypothetical protein
LTDSAPEPTFSVPLVHLPMLGDAQTPRRAAAEEPRSRDHQL